MKSRSRENIARLEDNVSNEVQHCFHMARPATVISSSSLASPGSLQTSPGGLQTSPGGGHQNSTGSHQTSPVGHQTSPSGQQTSSAVGDTRLNVSSASSNPETSSITSTKTKVTNRPSADVEWTSLVDTATRAMLSGSPEEEVSAVSQSLPQEQKTVVATNCTEVTSHSLPTSTEDARSSSKDAQLDYAQLLDRVSGLEEQLDSERAGKQLLTNHVEQLQRQLQQIKVENARLQEESQTAAQQLRRFTEWFFQTIDKS